LLRHLYIHLNGKDESEWPLLSDLEGGIRWALGSALSVNQRDYWARVTLADLEVLTAQVDRVTETYQKAVALADGDWFNLDSSKQQLTLLALLGFRPRKVAAGLQVIESELNRLERPEQGTSPERVVLFSGHMIDREGRDVPRFPPAHEADATARIEAKFDELGAEAGDVGICGGACGGDLIFAERCLNRNMFVEIRIPFPEPRFLEKSVRCSDDSWQERFYQVVRNQRAKLFEMSEELGRTPSNHNDHAGNNIWQLYSALCRGPDKVSFIALWDGRAGDAEGGTEHMWNAVSERHGRVYRIDANELQPV